MCGRFCIASDPGEVKERYGVIIPNEFKPSYNVTPNSSILFFTRSDDNIQANLGNWGFHKPGLSYPVINARSEGLQSVKLFKNILQEGRCIIPVTGYFEWKKLGKEKEPWYIYKADEPLFSLAGLCRDNNGRSEVVIITEPATGKIKTIHSRMPLVLNKTDEDAYLRGLHERSFSPRKFEMHKVSPLISKASVEDKNDPDLIKPFVDSNPADRQSKLF